ncbi:right-handed parallel beta-helix repeat-containing protein [Desulfovibrio inopinatus]|uniref:right-handed parallel beta-helix repeat-containing protein n=1 Tax=Desulfovibrio inopinatus TaxID=102109 RepID=UPI00042825F9|nr:right-handed parallel beta-helix repeat-containing protein [Desulfovibrio inopinatus]
MPAVFANNAGSELALDISADDTVVTVLAGEGEMFPVLEIGKNEFFHATLVGSDGAIEIIKVTDRVGDALTVERGREDTLPRSFAAGDVVELRLTAENLSAFLQSGALDGDVANRIKAVYYVSSDADIADHGDADTEGSLAWTLGLIGDGEADVVLPGGQTFTVTTDMTVPSGVRLYVGCGALLAPGNGVTVTIDGGIVGPRRPIFSGSGTITGNMAGGAVLPQWFGAVGDGDTDDTRALQNALKFPKVFFPIGIYGISAPLDLRDFQQLEGEMHNSSFIDWEKDHEQYRPSYAGSASIIQYLDGQTGTLFNHAHHISFKKLVFRNGQVQRETDVFMEGRPNFCSFEDCKFENFNHILYDATASQAFGANGFFNCKFASCGTMFRGVLVDFVFVGNTFTSNGTCFEATSGSGFNTFSANRFEWNKKAILNYQGRSNVITGNLFDAHEETAIMLHYSSDNHIAANLFWRNGRDGSEAGKRSHIVIQETSSHNHIQGNTFLKGGPDDQPNPAWPKYIIEFLGAADTENEFTGNATINGCMEMPVYDPYWNSANACQFDDIHVKGIGNPNMCNDNLLEIVKQIASLSSSPVNVHLYEDRKFTFYADINPDRVCLIGHGSVTLSDDDGQANRLRGLSNVVYGQTFRTPPITMSSDAVPTMGYWGHGTVVWNSAPAAEGYAGWICTEAGNPGIWKGFGVIET